MLVLNALSKLQRALKEALESASRSWSYCARSLGMSEPDPKTTLREFREYVAVASASIAIKVDGRLRHNALISHHEIRRRIACKCKNSLPYPAGMVRKW